MTSKLQSQHPDGKPTSAQPRWRRDFPIDTAEDEYISRRDFAKFLVLISAAMATGQVCLVVRSAARRHEAQEPLAIKPDADVAIGQVVQFTYPGPKDKCLLARLDDGRLIAFGQLCSHLMCPVIPDMENRKFVCPCHKGYFDMETGRPLAGPPRRPLPRIVLHVGDDGMIFATGVELST
jgi:Rieske Fe-S protein